MSISRTRAGAIAAACAALVASVVVASAASGAGTTRKTYTASASPTTLTAAPGQTASITLKNTTTNNISFAAANITVPSGLVVDPTVRPTLTPTRGTAELFGSVLKLRNLSVSPGHTVKVTFTLKSVSTACKTFVWATDVRQSNDFNGTLNKFTLTGPPPTMQGPCSSVTVVCSAGDNVGCATPTIVSPSGDAAQVTVQDSDTLSGTLEAELTGEVFQCNEYTTTSDQLFFDFAETGTAPGSAFKSVVFSQAVVDARPAFEYQVCFRAPYDFPALLPSQLAADFANDDFSGNTQPIGSEFKGLLLPCTAGKGVPCIQSRTISGGRITVTFRTQVGDPAARF